MFLRRYWGRVRPSEWNWYWRRRPECWSAWWWSWRWRGSLSSPIGCSAELTDVGCGFGRPNIERTRSRAGIAVRKITDHSVERVAADNDRTTPGSAESEQQRHAQPDDDHEPGDDERSWPADADGERACIHDQGDRTDRERDHVKGGKFSRCRSESGSSVGGESVERGEELCAGRVPRCGLVTWARTARSSVASVVAVPVSSPFAAFEPCHSSVRVATKYLPSASLIGVP